MKLTVKTLKGVKFDVQVEDSHTVAQVKDVIVRGNENPTASSSARD